MTAGVNESKTSGNFANIRSQIAREWAKCYSEMVALVSKETLDAVALLGGGELGPAYFTVMGFLCSPEVKSEQHPDIGAALYCLLLRAIAGMNDLTPELVAFFKVCEINLTALASYLYELFETEENRAKIEKLKEQLASNEGTSASSSASSSATSSSSSSSSSARVSSLSADDMAINRQIQDVTRVGMEEALKALAPYVRNYLEAASIDINAMDQEDSASIVRVSKHQLTHVAC